MVSIDIFIPGRLKSTRLPNKLIKLLGDDNCLYNHACELLNSLPTKYGKIALVQDPELINIANQYKYIKFVRRSVKTTYVDGPLNYIFGDLKHSKADYFMFLNPCFMFLKSETIINALKYFEELVESNNIKSMTSVKPFKSWLYHGNKLLFDVNENWSTKDIDNYFEPAHMFHIFHRDLLFKDNTMLDKNHSTYIIDDEMQCLDVDTETDFKIVKSLYEK
jgi:CMP-N-acetylneuraminic acid synthetase